MFSDFSEQEVGTSRFNLKIDVSTFLDFSEEKINFPANIRLDEDVLIKTNMFASALRLQKTSSRRLGQD